MPALFSMMAAGEVPFPIVQATNTSKEDSSTTSHTVSLPASISAGDLLIIIVSMRNNPTITTPAGWTELFKTGNASLNHAAYWKSASGSEGASVTVTIGTARTGAHNSYRITGWTAIEGAVSVSNLNPPNLAPAWSVRKTLWLVTGANLGGDSSVGTIPTAFTDRLEIADTLDTVCASGRRNMKIVAMNPYEWFGEYEGGTSKRAGTIGIKPRL